MTGVLDRLIDESRGFFIRHGVPELAARVPSDLALTAEQLDAIGQAETDGLTQAFLFPPVEDQMVHTEALIENMAARPLAGLDVDNQYTQPWVQDLCALKATRPENRPENGYLLFYSPTGIDSDTKGLTALELSIYLKGAKRRSMTARCTTSPAVTFMYSCRIASVARNDSGRKMRRPAESSSVRSSHCADAVDAASGTSAMR